ncbi:MAG: helix-turn-helix transcriptional regulator [Bacteroidales bacterium]
MSLLKQLIQSKGIKQKWLAQKLGVSEVTISNWVGAKTIPNEENLKKLSEIMDISIETLSSYL